MPVNTEHPEYIATKDRWARMRAVAAGQDKIHEGRERWLPRLSGEGNADYNSRLKRSSFFNATARTIEGLVGMVMRVDPKVELTESVRPMLEDVTKSGVSFATFTGQVLEEVLTVGRSGVLPDFPSLPPRAEGQPAPTVAEVQAMNLRPHLVMYRAESIINWATEWIDNKTATSMVVLSEFARVPGVDEFEVKVEQRWRVLDLAFGALGFPGRAYRVRVFRSRPNGGGFELVGEPVFPLLNGQPMKSVPFQFIGPKNNEAAVQKPPLLDLADVNLSHYRSTSDRKHGAHLTALPQPWANKINPAFGPDGAPVKQEWKIGGTDLWTFPNDSQVGMLEYTGQGLSTLKEEIEREEKQMAVLGARMLEQQQRQVETAEAAGIHRSGEQSNLQMVAGVVGAGLSPAMSVFDAWGGGQGVATVALNKDLMPTAISSQELTALVAAWQNGALSKEALFYNLQTGGIVPESTTYEEHETQIANAPPALSTGLPAPSATPPAGNE
jgi:hypothetical protein